MAGGLPPAPALCPAAPGLAPVPTRERPVFGGGGGGTTAARPLVTGPRVSAAVVLAADAAVATPCGGGPGCVVDGGARATGTDRRPVTFRRFAAGLAARASVAAVGAPSASGMHRLRSSTSSALVRARRGDRFSHEHQRCSSGIDQPDMPRCSSRRICVGEAARVSGLRGSGAASDVLLSAPYASVGDAGAASAGVGEGATAGLGCSSAATNSRMRCPGLSSGTARHRAGVGASGAPALALSAELRRGGRGVSRRGCRALEGVPASALASEPPARVSDRRRDESSRMNAVSRGSAESLPRRRDTAPADPALRGLAAAAARTISGAGPATAPSAPSLTAPATGVSAGPEARAARAPDAGTEGAGSPRTCGYSSVASRASGGVGGSAGTAPRRSCSGAKALSTRRRFAGAAASPRGVGGLGGEGRPGTRESERSGTDQGLSTVPGRSSGTEMGEGGPGLVKRAGVQDAPPGEAVCMC